jgi:hypothetical protein
MPKMRLKSQMRILKGSKNKKTRIETQEIKYITDQGSKGYQKATKIFPKDERILSFNKNENRNLYK